MESTLLTAAMPAALAIIMLGLGLSLAPADFRGVLRQPKPVGVALVIQVLVLPLACAGIAWTFRLPETLAVGMMLLAASPGGTTANLFSHLFGGDVALNVVLTAINSLLALLTLPVIVYLSLWLFMGSGKAIPMPMEKLATVFGIVLVPIVLGMGLRARRPAFAARMALPVKRLSALFLAGIIVSAALGQWRSLLGYVSLLGGAALSFNLLSLGLGYVLPRLLHLNARQSLAISMEVGVHNATLAIAIAMSPQLLGNPEMAMPSIVYGALTYLTASLFGLMLKQRGSACITGAMNHHAV